MSAQTDTLIRELWQTVAAKFQPVPVTAAAIVKDYSADSEGRVLSYQLDVEEPQGFTQHTVRAPVLASYGRGTRVTVSRRGGAALGEWSLDDGVSGYGSQTPVLYGGVTTVEPTLIEGLGFHIPRGDGCIIVGGVLIRDPLPRVEGTRVRICANGIKGLTDNGEGDELAFMFATEDHQFFDRGQPYQIRAGDAQLGYRSSGHVLVDSVGGSFSWNVGDETLLQSRMVNGLPYTQMVGLLRLSDYYVGEGIEMGRDWRGAYVFQMLNKFGVPLIVARAGYGTDPNRAYLRIGPPPPFPTIEVTSTSDGTPVIRIDGRALMASTVGAISMNVTYISDITGNLGVVRAGRAEFLDPATEFNLWEEPGNATGLVVGYNEATQSGALMGLNAGAVQTSINADGTLTAINADISGTLTAALGIIGGWTIATGELSSGSVKLQSTAQRILLGAATAPLTGTGLFLGKDGADYEFRIGDPTPTTGHYIHWDGTNIYVHGSVVNDLAPGSDQSLLAWTITSIFSSTDADTVAWTSGELTFSNGVNYAILAGNTGNLPGGITYIYWDATNSDELQLTETYANAVGPGKIPIATASPSTTGTEAGFIVLNGSGINVRGPDIVAGSIVAANIAAGTITAVLLNVTTLSAITANMGTLTSGEIRVGTGTVGVNFTGLRLYDTGSGLYALSGLSSNVEQTRMDTDGKFKWAAGRGILSLDGLDYTLNSDNYVRIADNPILAWLRIAVNSVTGGPGAGIYITNDGNTLNDYGIVANANVAAGGSFNSTAGVGLFASGATTGIIAGGVTLAIDGLVNSALTGTVADVLRIRHNTSGTPSTNFGSRVLWQLESSTTIDRDAAAIDVLWSNATDGTRTSQMDWFLAASGGTLTRMMRMRTTGLRINTIDSFASQGTLHVQALSGTTIAARFTNSNFVGSSVGSSLIIAHGTATGNTFSFLQATDTGATVVAALHLNPSGGDVNLGSASNYILMRGAPAVDVAFAVLAEARTLTTSPADSYASAISLNPTYSAASAQTVTRHNYINIVRPILTNVTITNACLFRFPANAGTHEVLAGASTKATPGTVNGWIKVNVNGSLMYIPLYSSTTS